MLKKQQPSDEKITEYIGTGHRKILDCPEDELSERYELHKELRFPLGDKYGWGYKYSHKTKHLCYIFFEKLSLSLLIQIGKREIAAFLKCIETASNN
ncbi:MAG: DUF3788 family protein [Spirochaetales bacterium]|nr:DUF3788 family protein [Spirochaetales bacterium]